MSDTISDDRHSELFDIARDRDEAAFADLSEEERRAVREIRQTLDAVDASWVAPPERLARVRELFLKKLAEHEAAQ